VNDRLHKPLLKWPGGKRHLLGDLLPAVPSEFWRYFEPFVGGGALFFALCPKNAHLSDTNVDLINCYVEVQRDPDAVISHLCSMVNSKAGYYTVRRSKPSDPAERAARIVYLATLAFNGIYRVNLKGEFNVPYGGKTHLNPADPVPIRAASQHLSNAELRVADFQAAVAEASKGDFVYFDPPYTVAHSNNGFVKYNERIFNWDDQVRLAQVAHDLADRGCAVVVSNADHPRVRELYIDFEVRLVIRSSKIAASSKYRRPITECIFVGVGSNSD